MPIRIKVPLVENFILEKSDKLLENTGNPTIVKIRQASQGEEEERNALFALTEKRIHLEDGMTSYHTYISVDDVWREEVWLTLADCNIENEDGEPLFQFKANRISMEKNEFKKAWGRLDPHVASEIIEKVHAVNQQWGPAGNA